MSVKWSLKRNEKVLCLYPQQKDVENDDDKTEQKDNIDDVTDRKAALQNIVQQLESVRKITVGFISNYVDENKTVQSTTESSSDDNNRSESSSDDKNRSFDINKYAVNGGKVTGVFYVSNYLSLETQKTLCKFVSVLGFWNIILVFTFRLGRQFKTALRYPRFSWTWCMFLA